MSQSKMQYSEIDAQWELCKTMLESLGLFPKDESQQRIMEKVFGYGACAGIEMSVRRMEDAFNKREE